MFEMLIERLDRIQEKKETDLLLHEATIDVLSKRLDRLEEAQGIYGAEMVRLNTELQAFKHQVYLYLVPMKNEINQIKAAILKDT